MPNKVARGIKCYPCPFIRMYFTLWFPFNNLSFLEATDFNFGNVVADHKTQTKFNFDREPICRSRVMALDSLKT